MRTDPPWRAVATDLDGTIVHSDGTVSPATVDAARALRDRSVPLVAVTARTPAGVTGLGPLASLLDIAVCCGGSLGWRPSTDHVLWRDDIATATAHDIVRAATTSLGAAGVAGYDGRQWIMSADYPAIRGLTPRGPSKFGAPDDITAAPLCAIAIAHANLHPEEMTARLMAAGVGSDSATFTYGADRLLDITPARIDKGSGLRKSLDHLGIPPSAVVAFGDMPNDLPVFDLVGLPVAVANAHPLVLAAASVVTGPVEDDGVARALARLGLIRAGQYGHSDVEADLR